LFTIQQYLMAESLEEAYNTLLERKTNSLLGGCGWLRMGKKRIGTAIDLSGLNLNFILENENYIEIGAMTTFRDLETSELLNQYFNGIIPVSISSIIGVQFRNIVTVGGSVFSKFGFSDFITALLALDTEVELYKGGRRSLEEFLKRPYEKDILVKLRIKKENRQASFRMLRNSAVDFPIVNTAVSQIDGQWKIVIGARPVTATVAEKASGYLSNKEINEQAVEIAADYAVEELSFGTNMRGSKEYRKTVAKVLVKRAIMEVMTWR
jgi:CO/xanthine dehydrogenase FAD-binding subunit